MVASNLPHRLHVFLQLSPYVAHPPPRFIQSQSALGKSWQVWTSEIKKIIYVKSIEYNTLNYKHFIWCCNSYVMYITLNLPWELATQLPCLAVWNATINNERNVKRLILRVILFAYLNIKSHFWMMKRILRLFLL